MIKRISVTLTEEDVDAALIAYISQKYGTLRNAEVSMKFKIELPKVEFIEAQVSGDVD